MAKPQPPFDLSMLLTIKTIAGAHRYINETFDVPVSFNFVRSAVMSGDIPSERIGRALFFSTQDLYDWV
jgi:hypothetical protein